MFCTLCIAIAVTITAILFAALLTLVFMPSPQDVVRALKSKEMVFSLKLTIETALASTAAVMAVSIPAAYAIARHSFLGKSLVRTIIDMPIAMPELVLGLALLLLFGRTPLGTALAYLGIRIVFTKLGVIVAEFFTALPYTMRMLCSSFEAINPRYELVSRSLGYSELETFFRVTLPLARSGIIASTIVAFARSVGTFGTVLILAGGTYMVTETLPITLYLNISYGNLGMAITSGLLLLAISFTTILAIEKLGGGAPWGSSR